MSVPSLEQEYGEQLLKEYEASGLSIETRIERLAAKEARNTAWETKNSDREEAVSSTVATYDILIAETREEIRKALDKVKEWVPDIEEQVDMSLYVGKGKKGEEVEEAKKEDDPASGNANEESDDCTTEVASTGITEDLFAMSMKSVKTEDSWVQ